MNRNQIPNRNDQFGFYFFTMVKYQPPTSPNGHIIVLNQKTTRKNMMNAIPDERFSLTNSDCFGPFICHSPAFFNFFLKRVSFLFGSRKYDGKMKQNVVFRIFKLAKIGSSCAIIFSRSEERLHPFLVPNSVSRSR